MFDSLVTTNQSFDSVYQGLGLSSTRLAMVRTRVYYTAMIYQSAIMRAVRSDDMWNEVSDDGLSSTGTPDPRSLPQCPGDGYAPEELGSTSAAAVIVPPAGAPDSRVHTQGPSVGDVIQQPKKASWYATPKQQRVQKRVWSQIDL